ncbi:6007_t:CDS:2, partial [Cetraspora pellucida]
KGNEQKTPKGQRGKKSSPSKNLTRQHERDYQKLVERRKEAGQKLTGLNKLIFDKIEAKTGEFQSSIGYSIFQHTSGSILGLLPFGGIVTENMKTAQIDELKKLLEKTVELQKEYQKKLQTAEQAQESKLNELLAQAKNDKERLEAYESEVLRLTLASQHKDEEHFRQLKEKERILKLSSAKTHEISEKNAKIDELQANGEILRRQKAALEINLKGEQLSHQSTKTVKDLKITHLEDYLENETKKNQEKDRLLEEKRQQLLAA